MNNQQFEINNKILNGFKGKAGLKLTSASRLASALANFVTASYYDRSKSYSELWNTLENCLGKSVNAIDSFDEFWIPLRGAIAKLASAETADLLGKVLKLRMTGLFSSSIWRRSYRSNKVSDYIPSFLYLIHAGLLWHCYEVTAEQAIKGNGHNIPCFEEILALYLFEGNKQLCDLAMDAMLGENQNATLSPAVVSAIIKSGNPILVETLGKLLLAAQLQEGLRQMIFERMDHGSKETTVYFLKLILDHNLMRFSSAARAMDVCTGLNLADSRPAVLEKSVLLAYECLSDESKRKTYLNSDDNIELYFALWGAAFADVRKAQEEAYSLLKSPIKYKRMVALYFISCCDNADVCFHIAQKLIDDEDDDILAWTVQNLYVNNDLFYLWGKKAGDPIKSIVSSCMPKTLSERTELFSKLESALARIGTKSRTVQGAFPWLSIKLENTQVLGCMMTLAVYDLSPQLVERLFNHTALMSVEQRRSMCYNFLEIDKPSHRKILQELLGDKSIYVKQTAAEALAKATLDDTDIQAFVGALSTKSATLRKAILELLEKQPVDSLRQVFHVLRNAKDDNLTQAALSLLEPIQRNQPVLYTELLPLVNELQQSNLSSQNELTLARLTPQEQTYTAENGYGLYDPSAPIFTYKETNEPLFSHSELKNLIVPDKNKVFSFFKKFADFIIENRDYEYEIERYDGSREKVLLGDANYGFSPIAGDKSGTIDSFPLANEFRALCKSVDLKQLIAMLMSETLYAQDNVTLKPWFEKTYGDFLLGNTQPHQMDLKYVHASTGIIRSYLKEQSNEVFAYCFKVFKSLRSLLGPTHWNKPFFDQTNKLYYYRSSNRIGNNSFLSCALLTFWRGMCTSFATTDELYTLWFLDQWNEYLGTKRKECFFHEVNYFLRAHSLGLIDDQVLYAELLGDTNGSIFLRQLTKGYRYSTNYTAHYPLAPPICDIVTSRIAELEATRGELDTALTPLAKSIGRLSGCRHFVRILCALGKEAFYRGYEYYSDGTKKSVLSSLIKCCRPLPDEDVNTLRELLKDTDITEKRLAEVSMYAPQWAEMLEEITGWEGLKCSVWFFHAHVNESFSAEKETEAALFSPLTPQEFVDGAFDKNWFLEAYHTLGEKRFQLLYKSAKYITNGSIGHRRSQMYADATLGKLNEEILKGEIADKRNQEKLRAFPLIPLGDDKKASALSRYEFIRAFEKQSKQFGAQRRASEQAAVRTALSNLALTYGFADVERMIWSLEGAKFESVSSLLEPTSLNENTSVRLCVTDTEISVACTKNGKELKSVPKDFAKHDHVILLRDTSKELREQRSRCIKSLERAMVEGASFHPDELLALITNPVLRPLATALLWRNGDCIGFATGRDHNDENMELSNLSFADEIMACKEDVFYIAHPYDFKTLKIWSKIQRYALENELVQPFKQIFRELYTLTEEELSTKNISRRYAGNQVQPKKTLALLKTRGWTVDYEEGLQRVYHKENLIVRMYAMADWFTPAEIEAPTLEVVRFFNRTNEEPVNFTDVPPLIFSEAMRDIDLVVSVAHVGGVDPEASHSTVDMRIAIAQELLPLLKITNITFVGSHAKIKGSLGEYSIHMGSGVVHQSGAGMIMTLPVHSQKRGRLFLPFADSDPKTAEIMSKLVLFAEDGKIKDPHILTQICRE